MSDEAMRTSPADGSLAYRGIRAFLARVLRVPMHASQIPVSAGELLDSFHPAPGWLRMQQMIRVFFFSLLIIGTVFTAVVLGVVQEPVFYLLLLVPIFILLPLFWLSFVALRLRFDCTWYVLTERALRIRRGLIVIQETTITYENVQNVSVQQGPLQRIFGVSNITVETAGGGGASAGAAGAGSHGGLIEGIDRAEELRERIMTQVRRSRSAGLGDEHLEEIHLEAPGPVGTGTGWTEIASVLREIRDGMRAASS